MPDDGASVYVLQRECGDVYCGCGGGHIVGVFTKPPEMTDLLDTVTAIPLDQARWREGLWEPAGAWT